MNTDLIYRPRVCLHTRPNKSGEVEIQIRLTFNGDRVNLSTGYTVPKEKWDENSQQVKRNCTNSQGYTFAEINDGVAKQKSIINKIFKQYELLGRYPLKDEFKEKFKIELGKKQKVDRNLLSYYDEFTERRSTLNTWSKNTQKKYSAIRRKLEMFDVELGIEDLNEAKLTELTAFLQQYWKNNSTFTKRWQDMTAFFKWCNDNNYPIHTDVKRYRIKLKTANKTIIYLTAEELLRVYNYKFDKKHSHLELARDWFCLSAFTSLRFSDVERLSKKDVHGDYIEITTKKDSDPVKIELNKYSKAIIAKYKKNPFAGECVFPRKFNTVINKQLKKIGRLCGIDETITETRFEGAERIDDTKPKYECITTHTGRKTFICLALSMGIPPTTVMAWTGHESYEDMKPYIKITDQAKAQAMAMFDTLETQQFVELE